MELKSVKLENLLWNRDTNNKSLKYKTVYTIKKWDFE